MLRVLLLAFVALLACAGSAAAASSPANSSTMPSTGSSPGRADRRVRSRSCSGGDAHGAPGRCGQTQEAGADPQHRPHAHRQHLEGVQRRGRARARGPGACCRSTTPSASGCRALPAAWGGGDPAPAPQPHERPARLHPGTSHPGDAAARPPHRLPAPRVLLRTWRTNRCSSRPGSQFHYSNSDNIVVALMAEQATGRPYDALLGLPGVRAARPQRDVAARRLPPARPLHARLRQRGRPPAGPQHRG